MCVLGVTSITIRPSFLGNRVGCLIYLLRRPLAQVLARPDILCSRRFATGAPPQTPIGHALSDRAFLALTRQPNIFITPLRGDLSFIRTPDSWSPHPLHHPCVIALRGSIWDRVGYPSGWATFQGRPWRAVHRGGVTLKPPRPTGNGVPHPPSRPGGTREARTNLPDPEVNLRRPLDYTSHNPL